MAVQKATFQADFGDFNQGVIQAEQGLRKLEGSSKVVEGQFQRMTAAAVDAALPAQQLTTNYKQFDDVLNATGVHIGPQIKALQDLTSAAGQSVTALGALGTAGLIAATAAAVIKVHELADEFFRLNPAITDATALILGYGSAIGEAAANKTDTLARASALAGKEITSLAAAIKILEENQKNIAARQTDWVASLGAAQREVRNLTTEQKDAIAIAQQAGATTEELTRKYGISKQGLEELGRANKVTADQVANLTKEHEKQRAAIAETSAAIAKETELRIKQDSATAGARAAEAAATQHWQEQMNKIAPMFSALAKATAEAKVQSAALATEQAMLEKDYQATVTAAEAATGAVNSNTVAHQEAGAAAEAGTQLAVAGYQQVGQAAQQSARDIIALNQYSSSVNAILAQNPLYTSASQYSQIARLPTPSFQSGVTNFAGGVAQVHKDELLVNLPAGTSVIPRGGGGTTVYNTFHLVDTESNLARRVSETILRTVRAGTQLGTT